MSITFDRRTFLKTGAALIGGGVLVGLTGCDSSSTSSPAVSKKVDIANDSFKIGKELEISFMGSSGGAVQSGTAGLSFEMENLTASDIVLYSDSFSAYCNGKALRLMSVNSENTTPAVDSVTLTKEDSTSVSPLFSLPAGMNADDVIFKFHYGDKSIKFQSKNNGTDLYTSGVYTDKVKI